MNKRILLPFAVVIVIAFILFFPYTTETDEPMVIAGFSDLHHELGV